MAVTQEKNYCPVAIASMVLSSKWDLILIHSLLDHPMRFSEIKRKISNSFPRELTASSLSRVLRRLEASGIILKKMTEGCSHPTYSLTQKGKDLEPVLDELYRWGQKHIG